MRMNEILILFEKYDITIGFLITINHKVLENEYVSFNYSIIEFNMTWTYNS